MVFCFADYKGEGGNIEVDRTMALSNAYLPPIAETLPLGINK
jgi:hypothetical protein